MMEDDELAELFQEGVSEAFDAIVTRYSKPLVRFFYRLCWQRELAEDLAQEVFIKLYHSLKNYQSKGNFRSYIYTIAKNIWIDFLRSKKGQSELRKASVSIEAQELLLNNLKTREPSAEEVVYYKEKCAILQQTLETLSTEQKLVFMMHNEDMKYSDIAQALSIPEGTVKSRLHYIFRKLRKALFEEE